MSLTAVWANVTSPVQPTGCGTVQNWVEHKLVDVMFKWAEKYELALGEDMIMGEASADEFICGVSGKYRIMLHFGEQLVGDETPHLQLAIDGGKKAAERFFW